MTKRKKPEPLPNGYMRFIAPGQKRRMAVIKGQDYSRWTDFYQYMLGAPWWLFLSILALGYFAVNTVFALLYLADPGGIQNAHAGSFRDALFFSMQTLGVLSTSSMAPADFYTDSIVTLESFFSVLNIAIATGAIFARVARPTSPARWPRCRGGSSLWKAGSRAP